ncbi:MAG: sodium ion-translocating decarboxylase subunit beta [Candidatus Sumerlaeia bacterium]|nr:sodium ion-translocating decarboxylase subunit beta [Candidatus Sumerlaeia bacterium]
MILIGLTFIYLAIKKGFEPLLLVPIGFGILIGNIPYDSKSLSLSIYDGPVSEHKIAYVVKDEPVEIAGQTFNPWTTVYDRQNRSLPLSELRDLVDRGRVFMIAVEETMTFSVGTDTPEPGIRKLKHGGHEVFVKEKMKGDRYPVVITPERQDPWNASVLWFLFRGVEWGIFPPLIFLGVGALTDFGPLLANPRTILLGAAAQFGIFGALLTALAFGFTLKEAGAIGIIGGADGPTAIFTCTILAPHLLGAVALAAYSYMAMVPIIQPPIMKLLTTKEERRIRMVAPTDVPKRVRIIFPICGFILTAFVANGALPLLGMLFFGNLLRESMVTERLAKTAQTAFIDIVTILLGVTVGAKTMAANFLTPQTIYIALLGVFAFAFATGAGVVFAKIMNKLSRMPINPLIGAAGVSAVPMAARVVHRVAQEEDPQNFLLMHAMGPNVAGVIGSAVAAGVLLSYLT